MMAEYDLLEAIYSSNRERVISYLAKHRQNDLLSVLLRAYIEPVKDLSNIHVELTTNSIFRASALFHRYFNSVPVSLDHHLAVITKQKLEQLDYPLICAYLLYFLYSWDQREEAAMKVIDIIETIVTPIEEVKMFFIRITRAFYNFKSTIIFDFDLAQTKFEKLQQELADTTYPFLLTDVNHSLAEIYRQKGELPKALGLFNSNLQVYQKLTPYPSGLRYQMSLRDNMGVIYQMQNNLTLAYDQFQMGLEIAEEYDFHPEVEVDIKFNLANLKIMQGEYEPAKQLLLQNLQHESMHKQHLSRSYNSLGVIEYYKGNLRIAEDYYKQCLEQADLHNDKFYQSIATENLGEMNMDLGSYERSLDYFLRSLDIKNQIGDQYQILQTLHYIGVSYYFVGKHRRAESFFHKSIQIAEKLGNDVDLAKNTFYLFQIAISAGDLTKGAYYLETLQGLMESNDNPHIDIRAKLAHIIALMNKKRTRFQVEAQKQLYELLDTTIADHQFAIMAHIYLIDILLTELQVYNKGEIIEEINTLFKKLYSITESQNNNALRVHVMALQAQYQVISGNYKKSIKILNRAIEIVELNNMYKLKEFIENEKAQISDQVMQMKQQLKEAEPVLEELISDNLKNYIKNVRDIVETANVEAD